jgi:hypothetical protein
MRRLAPPLLGGRPQPLEINSSRRHGAARRAAPAIPGAGGGDGGRDRASRLLQDARVASAAGGARALPCGNFPPGWTPDSVNQVEALLDPLSWTKSLGTSHRTPNQLSVVENQTEDLAK